MFPSASAGHIPHSHIHARLAVYTWSLAAGWVVLLGLSLALALSGHYHAEGNAIAGHVLLLLLGLAGIGFGSRNLRRALSSRNAARDALIEGELRARQLLERIPLVAFTCTTDGTITHCNPALLRLVGCRSPEIVGRNYLELLVPHEQRAAAEAALRSFIRDRTPAADSVGLVASLDGRRYTISWLHTLITDDRGTPVGLASLGEDITARSAEDLRLRLLSCAVEQSPAAVVITDAEGTIEYVNARFTEVTGYSASEALGRNPRMLSSGESSKEFYRELWETLLAGRDWRGVFHNRRKGGEPFWEEAHISPIRDSTGTIVRFVALKEDITARRCAEDALRESEARMRETLESTAAGYFLLDRQDRLVHANSAFLQFFEQPTLTSVRGRRFVELLPESERPELSEYLRRLTGGEESVGGQLRHHRADGALACFSFTAHLVRAAGALAGCEGFLIDTTAIHASEERYQMLFEQLLDGFALFEVVSDSTRHPVDYRLLDVNPAFEKIADRPAAAIVGRHLGEIFPTLGARLYERLAKAALTGEPFRIEDYLSEAGRHLAVAVFRPADSRLACLVRDITEKRQLEQQLQQAQKLEAVGQLAGGVAHDYNNILVAILMNLSLLRMETNLPPETAESLAELEREAKRAAALTRQLLVFSRHQAVQAVRLDFNVLLENILKMLRRLLGEHITIDCDLAAALPPLLADPGMLDQVVMNLCVNARDAMPDGGRLQLSTFSVAFPGPSAAHPEARAGTFLRLAVHDTGTGMDAATRQRIFEPFFTTKETGKGTGLGLATVFSIVKQHQGWIEVESAPGQGSTFNIYLPEAPATTETEIATTSHAPRFATGNGNSHETILLVEDDIVSRQTIGLTLRHDGYRVFEAGDGESANALWHQHHAEFDALITDVIMPGSHNGLELAWQLHSAKPELSIVIISGYSGDALHTAPPVEGVTYLAKPFDYETLTQALRTSLARHHR